MNKINQNEEELSPEGYEELKKGISDIMGIYGLEKTDEYKKENGNDFLSFKLKEE